MAGPTDQNLRFKAIFRESPTHSNLRSNVRERRWNFRLALLQPAGPR